MPSWIYRLKQRWSIQSNVQFWMIMLVFALTGSSSVRLGKWLMPLFGIDDTWSGWIYWPIRIVLITLVYQILLLAFAFALGQFAFFWNFEKKMWSRFIPSSKKPNPLMETSINTSSTP